MVAKHVSRRAFLKTGGLTLGALAVIGLGYSATQGSQALAVVETPGFSYGKDKAMSERILITYATRTGSTVDVAAAIGETLGARGLAVDVKPIKENPPTDGYGAVVVGSAVNGGKWLPEAVEFVQTNQQALNRVPVALFCVHIMNLGDDDKSRQSRLAYLNDVRPLVKPVDEAFFAGVGFDPARQSWFEGLMSRLFKVAEGDNRDWNKIRQWAESLPPTLQG